MSEKWRHYSVNEAGRAIADKIAEAERQRQQREVRGKQQAREFVAQREHDFKPQHWANSDLCECGLPELHPLHTQRAKSAHVVTPHMDKLQQLGQEYDAAPSMPPDTGEGELKFRLCNYCSAMTVDDPKWEPCPGCDHNRAVIERLKERREFDLNVARGMENTETKIRAQAFREAAADVCMYCGNRAPGYETAQGPNEAGNYTHKPDVDGALMLCKATAIWARIKFEGLADEAEKG